MVRHTPSRRATALPASPIQLTAVAPALCSCRCNRSAAGRLQTDSGECPTIWLAMSAGAAGRCGIIEPMESVSDPSLSTNAFAFAHISDLHLPHEPRLTFAAAVFQAPTQRVVMAAPARHPAPGDTRGTARRPADRGSCRTSSSPATSLTLRCPRSIAPPPAGCGDLAGGSGHQHRSRKPRRMVRVPVQKGLDAWTSFTGDAA